MSLFKKAGGVGIYVDGAVKNDVATARLLTILDKRLEQAIAGGRETTAVAIVGRLGELAGVKNLSISNCHISNP